MPLIELEYDLGSVTDSFEPLPAGQYFCQIDSCDLVTASSGKPMLKFVWKVVEGEYSGRRLFDNVVLSVDWKVKQYAKLIGVDSGTRINTDDFIGAEALLDVVTEVGQKGDTVNRIKSITPST